MTEFDTADLRALVEIIDAGSISAAGRRCGVPRATLSRQLAGLEESLGVRLLHRTTRALEPTPAGRELYARARRILEDLGAARAAVQRMDGVPRGRLRVSVGPGDNGGMLGALVTTYMARCPEVELEVVSSSRFVDLVAEGFDVALRAGMVRGQSLIGRKLWSGRLLAVGSPAYLAARGRPAAVADLAGHDCFGGFERGEVPQRAWPLLDGGEVRVAGRLHCNLPSVVRDAVLAGSGLGLLPDMLVAGDLAAGRLEPVLGEVVGRRVDLTVVYATRAQLDPKVRAFIDVAAEVMPAALQAVASG